AGVLALIEQFEGFEAPAGHWEKYLLPARLESYDPVWFDGLTFFGQAVWGRLCPRFVSAPSQKDNGSNVPAGNGRPMKAFTRSTPISLMLREDIPWLLSPVEETAAVNTSLTGRASFSKKYDSSSPNAQYSVPSTQCPVRNAERPVWKVQEPLTTSGSLTTH